jgi:FkbM family methyltransferase
MPFFLPNLKRTGRLDSVEMTICNVGSRKLSSADDYGEAWQIFAPGLTIYGFDADPEACDAANRQFEEKQADWNEFHLPIAIAEKTETATLYVTQHPMCSSLYPPNEAFLKKFASLSVMDLERTVQIETVSLDEFCASEEIDSIDFLQIDVQGADLQALKGAKRLLSDRVLAIQVEVEYAPLYVGQPLFGDIDRYLRDQGFSLFDITVARRSRGVIQSANRPGQPLWGDAIYLRDVEQTAEGRFELPEQAFKLACIADTLDFVDYALDLLKTLTLKHGSNPEYNFADSILESLNQISGLEQSEEARDLMAELAPLVTVQY